MARYFQTCVLIFFSASILAQANRDTNNTPFTYHFSNHFINANSLLIDSLTKNNTPSNSLIRTSTRLEPARVALYSAILPSFGQFYNRAYWKLPVFLGLGTWFGYNFVRLNGLYNDFKLLYQQNLMQSPIPSDADFNRRRRDFYRGQRDEFGVYIALVYALSIVDAYIDAHLFDFDTSDTLTLLPPSERQASVTLFRLNLSF